MPPEEKPLDADNECYTAKDFEEWLTSLTAASADALRIDVAARLLARASGTTPEDLKQEAFARILEGRRSIGRDVPIRAAFIMVMRSIASDEKKHRRRYPSSNRVNPESDLMFCQAGPTPEDQALWRHYWARMVKELEDEFADKPIVLNILRTELNEMAGIQSEPGLPLKLNERLAARKMLRRRLNLVRETMI